MRGKVLRAGGSIEVFVGVMIGVGEDCACHVVGIEQVGGFVAVVNRKHEAMIDAASDFADPVAGFEAGFRVLAILKRDLLCDEIFGDGTSGKRHGQFGEASAIPGDENFAEGVFLLKDAVDGERVEKLVGEDAARRNASGNFDGWAALPFLNEAREARRQLVGARRRAVSSMPSS